MGVQLNIKSAEARELAERVAELTGVSITEAVTEALRQRISGVERHAAMQEDARRDRETRVRALLAGSRDRWKPAFRDAKHGDLLYDDRGLPR